MPWSRSRPSVGTYYHHEVDGFLVKTNLPPDTLASWTQRRREGFLRKILRSTPCPTRAPVQDDDGS